MNAEQRGRFVRMPDVVRETGLSQATINRLHRRGQFPQKRRLSDACIGWWQADIEEWMASREAVPRRQ